MKKVKGLGMFVLSLGLLCSSVGFRGTDVKAASETGQSHSQREFHVGETPLHTYKDEETGVIVEVFAANPADAEKVKKERGWEKHEVELIKNPKSEEATTKDKVASAFYNVLGNTTAALIENFGEIKAAAITNTSGWDLVGSEYWITNGNYNSIQTDTQWISYGGDYMFRIPAHKAYTVNSVSSVAGWDPHMKASLYEADPGVQLSAGYVTSWNIYPSSVSIDYIVRSISSWVDFGEAEFVTTHRANYKTFEGRIDNVRYYD